MICSSPSSRMHGTVAAARGRFFALLQCALMFLLVCLAQNAHAQTTTLKITPITFDIIGLDSNKVTSGPNIFIVGARVCNIGSVTATNVTAKFLKTGLNNPYINLQDLDTYSTPSLPAGPDPDPANNKQYMYPNPVLTTIPSNCFDFYFNGVITRNTSAYFTKQDYIIQATATNAPTIQTPSDRALYIEKLVSQNRNSVRSLTGPTAVEVGKTYQYTLVVDTATGGYEQIEHFPNFPNNQFQIISIETSYSEPTNQKNQIAWGDACGWVYLLDFTKSTPNQSYCSGVNNITGGKAGGAPITTVYTVKILGPGNGAINNLIYDFSGSSYHYNSDYNTGGAISFTSVYPPNLTVSKTTSTPTIWRNPTGNTGNYTITVSNSSAANTGTATSVVISDPLPTGFTYASMGTITLAGGATRTTTTNPTAGTTTPNWGSFSIPAGGSVTIPFVVNIPTSVAVGTYQNGVTATYTSPDGTTGNQKIYDSASSTAEDITVRSLDCTTLYAVLGNSDSQASVGTRFVSINPSTGAISPQFLDITSVGGVSSVTGGFGISSSLLKLLYVDGNGGSGYSGIARIYSSNGGTPVNTGFTVAAPTAEHQVGVDRNGVLWTTVWNGNKNLYSFSGSANASSLGAITAAVASQQTDWFNLSEGDFAFDNAGNMWFISSRQGISEISLWLVDTSTRLAYRVATYPLASGYTKGAEFGPDGQLYIGVTNPSGTRNVIIYKYNPQTGQFSNLTASGGFVSPDFDDIQDMGSCIYPDTSDSGDAPSSYGTATHIVRDTLYLGSSVPDREANQSSSTSTADDTADSDDEDAFTTLPTVLSVSSTYTLSNIPVFNNTGSAATLAGWIDFNRDGIFQTSEGRTVSVPNNASAQTVTLSWSGLSGLSQGATVARFRLSSDPALTTATPTGLANSGEVEDYPVNIVSNADFGDAPASYQSAFHGINPSIRMGAVAPDAESAAQPNAAASGDDTNGTDDEDILSGTINVAQAGTYTLSNLSVFNNTGSTARLVGWIDFNRNGTFDTTEWATISVPSSNIAQTLSLGWTVPSDAQTGSSHLRLRFTTDTLVATGAASTSFPFGFASNGEVEDYAVNINLYPISGKVFEDVNYGGGAGRNYSTANTSATASGFSSGAIARSGVRVELYSSGGTFLTSTTTDASGNYTFPVPTGSYQIRVVNGTVSSVRNGWVNTLIPVQTYGTDGSTGTANAVTNKVGGEAPARVDAGSNTSSATLAGLTNTGVTPAVQAQSVAPVTVGTAAISSLDFGFNFDTIVNTNNSGQGSLRQFVSNANTLGDENLLAQSGSRKTLTNTNETLPVGSETSIFMIPAASLTSNVGVITLASTVQFSGTNAPYTILDGTTQTVNIADGNTGQLGTGGTVGIGADSIAANADDTVLNRIHRPEIEVKSLTGSVAGMGLQLSASNITVRGISIYGFGSAANATSNANIHIDDTYSSTLIEQNFVGFAATRSTFDCPTGGATGGGDNIRSEGGDDGVVRHNLIGCSAGKGFGVENGSERWQILGNEIRGNAIGNMHLDGIDIENGTSGQATVRGNLIAANWGVGVDSYSGAGSNTTEYNTIEGNGIGTSGGSPLEDAGIRIYGTGSTVRGNIIRNNVGSGIMVQATSGSNVFTQNVIHNNGKIGIDLLNGTDDATRGTSPFVTLNDNTDSDAGGNTLLNYPVFATATLSGNTLEVTGYAAAGATIELFLSDSDASGFGEGQVYLGTVTEGCSVTNLTTCLGIDQDSSTGTYGPATINGIAQGTDTTSKFQFSIPLSVLKGTVSLGSKLSATATLSGNTSEFSGQVPITTRITGTVFEDVNYGGGAGRNADTAENSAVASGFTAGSTVRSGVTVELYSSAGAYLATTTTDSTGLYTFNVTAGSYQVRVVNSTVSSARTGWVNTLRPVQTYRTSASTGTATAVTSKVGGEQPAEVDAPANTSSTLATLNAVAGQEVQSLAPVTVSTGSVSGVDFGFNFDTIVNANDNGQGSLAQFIVNASTLGDENKLAQSGNRKTLSNVNQTLPAGKETSIFMVPSGGLAGGVALIDLTGASDPALSAISGTNAANTLLDGTTQTVNIGDTNSGVLGTGGTVGTGNDGIENTGDEPTLAQVYRPEVQIQGRQGINGLAVNASNITLRGFAIRGFGQSTTSSDHGAITVASTSNLIIEGTIIGTSASSFSDPGAGNRTSNGIIFVSGAVNTTTLQNNLIGFTERRGIAATGPSLQLDTLLIQQNEIRSTNRLGTAQGGGIELNPDYSPSGTHHRLITIRQNLITATGTGDSGVELGYTPTDTVKRVEDNTITNNAFGGVSLSLDTSTGTAAHNSSTVRDYILHNIITGNQTGVQIYATGSISALENKTISQNAIYDNTQLGIDLIRDGVTGNDGVLTTAQPNRLIDYPIITSSVLTGNSLQLKGVVGGNLPSNAVPAPNNSTFAGSTVEFFITDNTPANQDGVVLLGDGRSKPHGEGAVYIGQGTTDASGNFDVTLTLSAAQVTALGSATNVTATATSASGNTSEFGAVLLVNTVSGRIFDDVNYGGGAGRDYTTANSSAINSGNGFASNAIGRSGVTLEVYDATAAGNPVDLDPVTAGVQNSVTTGAGGVYSIQLIEGNYQIRVVNSTVNSVRTATGGTPLAVQTFRTNASTGTALAVTGEVGGRIIAEVDPAANASSTLTVLNAVAGQEVQSLSSVNLTSGNVTGVDFGFNFDTIVNTNNAGQGSLRQFVLNSNILNNTSLNQVGQTAGKETSIFMIPVAAHTNGVAIINLASSVTVTDSNTTLTGLTQTTNIGDTNTGALGSGGTVGVDGLALSKVSAPEVEIILATGTSLQVNGTLFTLQGVALRGGNQLILGASGLPATGFLIDQSIFGTTARAFALPAAGSLSQQYGLQIANGSGTVQNNLIGYAATSGIDYLGGPAGVTIQNNEFQQNGRTISGGDAITLTGSGNAKAVTIIGNLIASSNSSGIQFEIGSVASNTVTNNSITRNGYGGAAARLEGAGIHYLARTATVNSTNTDLISKNLIFDNQKSGIVLNHGQKNVQISQNSFYTNGLTSIDFTTSDGYVGGNGNYGQGDGVTPNDGITIARQGNTGIDYPVFNTATLSGNTVNFSGFVGNGATTTFDGQTVTLEIYKADDDGNQNGPVIAGDGKNVPHGEGRTYLGSVILTLGTNGAFSGSLTVPAGSLTSSDFMVATSTIGTNTSEFSPLVALSGFTLSGTVYEDVQPNGIFEPTENWNAGSTVYVNLIQGGNVVATTTVPAGSGAFTFPSVSTGTYTLAVSSVAGTVGNPAPAVQAPTGWLYISPGAGTLQVDVNSTVTGQNFGLYHGSRVSGRVFYDDAYGASSLDDESKANNGLQDLSEKGVAGVTVTATAGSSTVSAVTSATGDFQMYLPHATFNGQSVVLGHQVQPATGNSLNNTLPVQLASSLNDGLAASRTFVSSSGQVYGTHFFGILRAANWRPDQSGTTSSPGIIDYTHSYIPQTLGTLSFATVGNLFYSVYGDTNCDGVVSDAEKNVNLLLNPVKVGHDWPRLSDGNFKPCEYHVLVSVPSNLAANSVDRVRVKAELAWLGSTVKNPLFVLDTTTTRTLATGGKLSLTKALRNVTLAESAYTVSNGGKVGDIIEYKITFTNSGDTPITDIVLGDNVPYFTDMVQNVYGATGEMELHCPSGTMVNVNLGAVSVIDLPLNLSSSCNISEMVPGETGFFLYQVKIR